MRAEVLYYRALFPRHPLNSPQSSITIQYNRFVHTNGQSASRWMLFHTVLICVLQKRTSPVASSSPWFQTVPFIVFAGVIAFWLVSRRSKRKVLPASPADPAKIQADLPDG